jgi:6-pyruvoyltetrahydropterin/6-carboxytetrahydropterin synthase
MHRVTREFHFCYGHRLLNYDGKCRHLHGHNGRVAITLAAEELDRLGMVMDFTEIKNMVQGWIDETLDHKMLLHREDPMLPIFKERGEPVFIMNVNPTAENIARLIFDFLADQDFPVREVTMWETESCCATYSRQINEP